MNVLFLTLLNFNSLDERNIYTDLLREFVSKGHYVYVISPVEKRIGKETYIAEEQSAKILRLKIGNIQKTNIIEKGISTLLIERQFICGIKKYFADVKFDLIMYSTPPITFCNAIKFVKERDGAKTYLLLKDIFPQNAIDLGMLKKTGVKGILYRYFRKKEKKLYRISDRIGCMSKANVDYVLKHNEEVNPSIVEVCPNCVQVVDKSIDECTKVKVRKRYSIPLDKKVFVYGGNLGKPQDIPFLLKCVERQRENKNVVFLIIGDGTEYSTIERYSQQEEQLNLILIKKLPKDDFDLLVSACDVGMIFLDSRFTIPNYPSRILSYMQAKLPVLACTDSNTDIGKDIMDGKFGWWCLSDDVEGFGKLLDVIRDADLCTKGEKSFEYLRMHFSSEHCYNIIEQAMK